MEHGYTDGVAAAIRVSVLSSVLRATSPMCPRFRGCGRSCPGSLRQLARVLYPAAAPSAAESAPRAHRAGGAAPQASAGAPPRAPRRMLAWACSIVYSTIISWRGTKMMAPVNPEVQVKLSILIVNQAL